jgi:hypothetical protein
MLRKRLGMLRGVYDEVMPYRDPHTAGPALWALYHQTGKDFEVSIVPVEGSMRWRKGLQALAIFALDNYAHALPDMQIRRSTRSMRRCFERFRLLRITTYPPVDFAISSQIVA